MSAVEDIDRQLRQEKSTRRLDTQARLVCTMTRPFGHVYDHDPVASAVHVYRCIICRDSYHPQHLEENPRKEKRLLFQNKDPIHMLRARLVLAEKQRRLNKKLKRAPYSRLTSRLKTDNPIPPMPDTTP